MTEMLTESRSLLRPGREDFEWIKSEVQELRGEATVFTAQSIDAFSNDEVVAAFRQAREADYTALALDAEALAAAADKRGAKTGGRQGVARRKESRYDAPEAPALGQLVEGLRAIYAEDGELLEWGMVLFEALHRAFPAGDTPAPARRKRPRARTAPRLARSVSLLPQPDGRRARPVLQERQFRRGGRSEHRARDRHLQGDALDAQRGRGGAAHQTGGR